LIPLRRAAIRDDAHGAVVLVASEASGEVLTGELSALEVKGVAVAVVRLQKTLTPASSSIHLRC
jgi:hypothetical protein